MRENGQRQFSYRGRLLFVICFLGVLMAVLFGRLWYIQVIRGAHYLDLAEKNRFRQIETPAPRGMIYDRKNNLLVQNEPSFSLVLRREFMKDPQRLMTILEQHFGIPREEMRLRLEEYRSVPAIRAITIKHGLTFEESAYTEAHRNTCPELSVEWTPNRKYPSGELLSHIIGYTGEVNKEELARPEFRGTEQGDVIGKSGVERAHNADLMGAKGSRKVIINSLGQISTVLEETPPIMGKDLHLSIDTDLQETTRQAMEGLKGAVVAMDPNTGEVLAMVSCPGYSTEIFNNRISSVQWKELIENPDRPLQNKAIQGLYAPGSVFKILVALAALEEGVITPETAFTCNGETEMLGRVVHCHLAGGHGTLSLLPAIMCSCNIYFYNVGLKLGIEKIHDWAVKLGMGRRTGIDLTGEREGLIPSNKWKMKVFHRPWYKGETISVAIGQGAVSISPLQAAYFMSCVATNRVAPPPRLEMSAVPPTEGSVAPLLPEKLHHLLVRSMVGVVEAGTAQNARLDGISVAGKTGTAQVINSQTADRLKDYKKTFRENAWFVCFAPAERPAVALAVIIEHGGHGGETAAPVAARVLSRFFELYPERK